MLGLIAAYSRNRVIGKNGTIPWDIPGEKSLFKRLTTGNIVIMGRRTYEDIGMPLPDRTNIIVSKSMYGSNNETGIYVAGSFDEALNIAGNISRDANVQLEECMDIYIAGGESLYREAMPLVDIMYITEIEIDIEGDTYFPEFDTTMFCITKKEYHADDIPYQYITYVRNHSV